MTLELRVSARSQRTPASCWWECMAMILDYYGRSYTHPSQYRSQFARPWNRPDRPVADERLPTIDQAMAHDPTLQRATELQFLEPYEWYDQGLPRNHRALQLLTEITGFRGFDRPPFGSWTANDVESRLRQFGPYMFCGSWNGIPHAILTVGLVEQTGGAQVVTIDPSRGFATSEALASFNSRMNQQMQAYNFHCLNPLYLPQARPVGAVVNH